MSGSGTRKQIDSGVARPQRRSLLRGNRLDLEQTPLDKRPAGPSSHSDPGMGSPTPPLPPGASVKRQAAFLTHPKIAGSFRGELGAADQPGLIVPEVKEEPSGC